MPEKTFDRLYRLKVEHCGKEVCIAHIIEAMKDDQLVSTFEYIIDDVMQAGDVIIPQLQ